MFRAGMLWGFQMECEVILSGNTEQHKRALFNNKRNQFGCDIRSWPKADSSVPV